MKKILIEIPSWLGDSVMTTPAIENIVRAHPEARLTLFGARASTAIFEDHPRVENIVVDESRAAPSRLMWLFRKVRTLGRFDAAITFRRTFYSRLFVLFANAGIKGSYRRYTKEPQHLVIRYNAFVNKVFGMDLEPGPLKIHFPPITRTGKPRLGINPGASYGNAKRWYPEKFAEVAKSLSDQYHIVIFGGPAETEIAADIETELKASGLPCENLAGKTTIKTLCQEIGGLSLFITGDSGPMHVAAAYKVPTVAIFGPTKDRETAQWMNPNGVIVKKPLPCSPCMKRSCPLGHHDCMKRIEAEDVLKKIPELVER